MYVIVVGGGQLGYHLAKALVDEGHEVAVIEKDFGVVACVEDELGSVCVHGNGCDAFVLKEAGADRASLFIAVTGMDEDNLVACQMAKHKFNVPRTIARLRNPKNELLFKVLGIDVTVSTVNLILEHISESIPTHSLTHLLSFQDSELEVVEMKVSPSSSVVGKQLQEVALPRGCFACLLIRKEQEALKPRPDSILESNDRIIVAAKSHAGDKLRNAFS